MSLNKYGLAALALCLAGGFRAEAQQAPVHTPAGHGQPAPAHPAPAQPAQAHPAPAHPAPGDAHAAPHAHISPAPPAVGHGVPAVHAADAARAAAPAASPTAEASDKGLANLNVSATRRETPVQQTPVAVSVFDQNALNQNHVNDLRDVAVMAPNLAIGTHGDSAAFDVTLRGIGSSDRTELGDPAVAFNVDGIYSPRPQGATALMYDLERLEVVRGPQGVAFGRNAAGGSVNLITAKPKDHYEANTDLLLGNYNHMAFRGMVNVPLDKTLALRFAGITDHHDGFVDYLPGSTQPLADKYERNEQYAGRVSALWTPTDQVRWLVSAERFMDNGTGTIALSQAQVANPQPGPDGVVTQRRAALIDSPGFLKFSNTAVRTRLDVRPNDTVEVTALGGWARQTRSNLNDVDAGLTGPATFSLFPTQTGLFFIRQENRTESSDFRSYSAELQVKNIGDAPFKWLVGGRYFREDNEIRFDEDTSFGFVRNGTSTQEPRRVLVSGAAFGQGTFEVTPDFRMTAGVRYTRDQKTGSGGQVLTCPGVNIRPDLQGNTPLVFGGIGGCQPTFNTATPNLRWDHATYLARAEADVLNDTVLLYAGASTGFKSGTFGAPGQAGPLGPGIPGALPRFDYRPERVTSVEGGVKSTLMEGTLFLNATGFYTDYGNLQVAQPALTGNPFNPVAAALTNERGPTLAAPARAQILGAEVELNWAPTAFDRITAFGAVLDATYIRYNALDPVVATALQNQPLNLGVAPTMAVPVSLARNQLVRAPRFNGTIAYDHAFVLPGGGRLTPRLQLHYESASFLTPFNRRGLPGLGGPGSGGDWQEQWTKTDASLTFTPADGAWSGQLWVRNLENRNVMTNVQYVGNQANLAAAYYAAPRTWGARLRYSWY